MNTAIASRSTPVEGEVAGSAGRSRPLLAAAPLGGIVVLAFALRLWGVGWQLPWAFHPDEGHYVWKAADMVRDGNLNPKYFRNPSLYTYLLAVQYKALDLLGVGPEGLSATPEILRPPSLYLLLGRLTSALLGAGTALLVYRLGADLLGRGPGCSARCSWRSASCTSATPGSPPTTCRRPSC